MSIAEIRPSVPTSSTILPAVASKCSKLLNSQRKGWCSRNTLRPPKAIVCSSTGANSTRVSNNSSALYQRMSLHPANSHSALITRSSATREAIEIFQPQARRAWQPLTSSKIDSVYLREASASEPSAGRFIARL